MCMHCTRRQFLGTSAAGGIALAAGHLAAEGDASSPPPARHAKVPICVIIAGKSLGNSWGLAESDLAPVMKRLAQAEKNLGNVQFVIGQANTAEQTARLLDRAGPEAPVLAIPADIFGLSNFNRDDAVMPTVFQQGRPAAVFHLPIIGGHDWCLVNPWREQGHRITLLGSSNCDELERAASLLRVIPLLRRSRVLVSAPLKGTPEAQTPEQVKQRLGVEMVAIADGRYDQAMADVDESAAKAEAQRWLDEAEGIVEPNREDVLKAARASLTLERLIAENRADGLCVGTCMGWLSRGFPCLGFSRLNDRGIPAACDGDMDCLLTMLIFQHALNQAGFLGNAGGVDTSKNAFHLSHCSAPLKLEGPDGPKAPYLLRRHAEVRGGAVTEVHYRIGQKITFTKLVHLDTLLMFTGKIIEVPKVPKGEERGCRTELVAEVDDADRLLAHWGGGALGASAMDYYASLHRVAYYGDHTRNIRHLAHLMGLKVVEEG
ncbi:MAG: twin-arginine translocation signal domain-containing protein [Pirellulales bacterium]|nr:twin-arginine translocation signal domain-containing protein [Pirellulales bacterium]